MAGWPRLDQGVQLRRAHGLEALEILARVMRGAGQRARCDEQKALVEGHALIDGEFVRRDKAVNGRMFAGRLEILAHGEEIDVRRAKIVHHGKDLAARLAEADHHARLGEEIRGSRPLARSSSASEAA